MTQQFLTYLLATCLLIQIAIWAITDPRTISERFKSYLSIRAIIYYILYIVGFIFAIDQSLNYPWSFLNNGLFTIIGLIIFFTGLLISIWAKFTMKSIWGVPNQHDIKRQNKIVTTGPFAFSRNPIYLGLILTYTGFFIVLKSYLIVLGLLAYWYFNNAAAKEEKLLEKHFGKKYLEYKAKVPRFI